MELQFEYPSFKYGENPSAIYLMKFDTGHFYIGSSGRVKSRFHAWRSDLIKCVYKNRVIADVIKEVSVVTFEIIRLTNKQERLLVETEYIGKFKDDPMLLNRRLNAVHNSGAREIPAHLVKPTKQSLLKPNKRPITQFTSEGAFIASYKSIAEAARVNNLDVTKIQRVLSGVRNSHRGLKYRYD